MKHDSYEETSVTEKNNSIKDPTIVKLFKNTELISKVLSEKLALESLSTNSKIYLKQSSSNDKYCKNCSKIKPDLKLW